MHKQDLYNLLLGTAIGDAFGAGVEFQDRNWIRSNVDFTHFINARANIAVPKEQLVAFTENYQAWDYTDDTEMTIGLLKALCADQPFTEDNLVQAWLDEYNLGIAQKGFGRNGHGSMRWFFSGEKTMEEIRNFQKDRPNPGNAPAMRVVPLGLLKADLINEYAAINAKATHPNPNAILASQLIAQAAHFFLIKQKKSANLIDYCMNAVVLNDEYRVYLNAVQRLPNYNNLKEQDFEILCGKQPIEAPYFLAGIHGLPSDSKYTTGAVLYILREAKTTFDALKMAIYLGGDVDSVASICTGILGGQQGLATLPGYMIEKVEGRDYIETLAQEYFILMQEKVLFAL